MIYLIAIVTGLILGATLSTMEKKKVEEILNDYTFSVFGALFGVVFFMVILGVKMTENYLSLEAVLWSLLGALILRLVSQLFTFQDEEFEFEKIAAHEFKKPKKFIKNKKINNSRGGD
jgi:uncharacterized membrane protein YeaQ/YmgE (transglycosylase-associated protein family)